jgi:hypothetical protein
MTPILEIPTPDLAVPLSAKKQGQVSFSLATKAPWNHEANPDDTSTYYAAPMLAKTRAAVTPMNPKKGAEAGQVSISTDMILYFGVFRG